jgi:antitoxin Xre/MbcA/ParS-like protein
MKTLASPIRKQPPRAGHKPISRLFRLTDRTSGLFNSRSGRIDGRSVAELYQITVSELARLTKVEAKTLLKTSDSPNIQKALKPFEVVARSLALMRNDVRQFRRWLNAANAELGNKTPLEMIREGRVRELAGIVLAALAGQPN